MAVAALFGWILSVEQVPQMMTEWMLSVSKNPYVLLLIVNLLLLVVGMFLDSTTAILVIAPIIAKPLIAAGVDPAAPRHGGGIQPDDRTCSRRRWAWRCSWSPISPR